MQQAPISAIQAIQAILTPAVGISAVGLILLGLSNRYSSMVNRIRLLNDEKRRLTKQLVDKGELGFTDNARYMSIRKQTEDILVRSKFVRNAILLMQSAVALFILTSISIGLNLFVGAEFLLLAPFAIFSAGMLCMFTGIGFAATEIRRSYKIVLIEVHGDE